VTLPQLPAAQNTVPSSDALDVLPPECEEVLANFWDYLDGNCSLELAERINTHVSSCVPCLRFQRVQERFFASLAELRWLPAPSHVHDRVRKALAAGQREDGRR
jgi:putative zinc finger protein